MPAPAAALPGGGDEVELVDDLVAGVEERLVALEYGVVEGGALLEPEGIAAAGEVGGPLVLS
ncbi:hypothetical protein GCM10010271_68530 [Streptomyces kurssanovii]|nr:hypothetical protein GCM10010271_68530 [Streptomyces kurssanovii]